MVFEKSGIKPAQGWIDKRDSQLWGVDQDSDGLCNIYAPLLTSVWCVSCLALLDQCCCSTKNDTLPHNFINGGFVSCKAPVARSLSTRKNRVIVDLNNPTGREWTVAHLVLIRNILNNLCPNGIINHHPGTMFRVGKARCWPTSECDRLESREISKDAPPSGCHSSGITIQQWVRRRILCPLTGLRREYINGAILDKRFRCSGCPEPLTSSLWLILAHQFIPAPVWFQISRTPLGLEM